MTATASPTAVSPSGAPPDGAPVADLPGFTHHYADANGTRLHYVSGGAGPAVSAAGRRTTGPYGRGTARVRPRAAGASSRAIPIA